MTYIESSCTECGQRFKRELPIENWSQIGICPACMEKHHNDPNRRTAVKRTIDDLYD